MEFFILFILIILNGLFAMSEMSIVSAKKVRLQQYADEGNVYAKTALELSTDNGTLLVAGQVSLDRLSQISTFEIPDELYDEIHTIGGYVMYKLGKIPRVGDKVEDSFYKYEVIDMDKNRVDRLLLYKKTVPLE